MGSGRARIFRKRQKKHAVVCYVRALHDVFRRGYGAFIGEIYYSVPSHIDGAVALAESSLNSNNVEIPSYTLPKCFGGVLQEEGKELLKRYVEIKEEGALVNFCKKLISL